MDDDELVRRRPRQRPQEHRVDDGEDRRRGGDPERQGQDRRHGEARAAAPAAQRVADVRHEGHGITLTPEDPFQLPADPGEEALHGALDLLLHDALVNGAQARRDRRRLP